MWPSTTKRTPESVSADCHASRAGVASGLTSSAAETAVANKLSIIQSLPFRNPDQDSSTISMKRNMP